MGRWWSKTIIRLRLVLHRRFPRENRFGSVILTLATAALLAGITIRFIESELRPVISIAAENQLRNRVVSCIEHAVMTDLSQRGESYGELVSIRRDQEGTIVSLSTDMAALNRLRGDVVAAVLARVGELSPSEVNVPLGNVIPLDLMWGKGPAITARSLSTGTVKAVFDSEFGSAGVNQTLHRLWLEVEVPVTAVLPGGVLELSVEHQLCISETVIVGRVPDTYLALGGTESELGWSKRDEFP